jgi:hypothetical protein
MRAGAHCPVGSEWFLPGREPARVCDWHTEDGVVLPSPYADWASKTRLAVVSGEPSVARPAGDTASAGFRITSPAAGDVFRFVPGVPARYATVGLRAAGAPRVTPISWYLDGRMVAGTRLPLVPGRHRIRAAAGSLRDEVEFEVKAPQR